MIGWLPIYFLIAGSQYIRSKDKLSQQSYSLLINLALQITLDAFSFYGSHSEFLGCRQRGIFEFFVKIIGTFPIYFHLEEKEWREYLLAYPVLTSTWTKIILWRGDLQLYALPTVPPGGWLLGIILARLPCLLFSRWIWPINGTLRTPINGTLRHTKGWEEKEIWVFMFSIPYSTSLCPLTPWG